MNFGKNNFRKFPRWVLSPSSRQYIQFDLLKILIIIVINILRLIRRFEMFFFDGSRTVWNTFKGPISLNRYLQQPTFLEIYSILSTIWKIPLIVEKCLLNLNLISFCLCRIMSVFQQKTSGISG